MQSKIIHERLSQDLFSLPKGILQKIIRPLTVEEGIYTLQCLLKNKNLKQNSNIPFPLWEKNILNRHYWETVLKRDFPMAYSHAKCNEEAEFHSENELHKYWKSCYAKLYSYAFTRIHLNEVSAQEFAQLRATDQRCIYVYQPPKTSEGYSQLSIKFLGKLSQIRQMNITIKNKNIDINIKKSLFELGSFLQKKILEKSGHCIPGAHGPAHRRLFNYIQTNDIQSIEKLSEEHKLSSRFRCNIGFVSKYTGYKLFHSIEEPFGIDPSKDDIESSILANPMDMVLKNKCQPLLDFFYKRMVADKLITQPLQFWSVVLNQKTTDFLKIHETMFHGQQAAIHWAIYYENLDTLNLLIANNLDLNLKNKDGELPLYFAVKMNCKISVIELLLAQKTLDINGKCFLWKRPLIKTVFDKNYKVAQLLLQHGARIDVTDMSGYTALHYAIEQNDTQMITLLLEYSAKTDLNKSYKTGSSGNLLYFAVFSNRPEAVKILLGCKNIDLWAYDANKTPFEMALTDNNKNIIDIFLCARKVTEQGLVYLVDINKPINNTATLLERVLSNPSISLETTSYFIYKSAQQTPELRGLTLMQLLERQKALQKHSAIIKKLDVMINVLKERESNKKRDSSHLLPNSIFQPNKRIAGPENTQSTVFEP